MSKYEVFSRPYFPVFGPEKTPYLDSFHAAVVLVLRTKLLKNNFGSAHFIYWRWSGLNSSKIQGNLQTFFAFFFQKFLWIFMITIFLFLNRIWWDFLKSTDCTNWQGILNCPKFQHTEKQHSKLSFVTNEVILFQI